MQRVEEWRNALGMIICRNQTIGPGGPLPRSCRSAAGRQPISQEGIEILLAAAKGYAHADNDEVQVEWIFRRNSNQILFGCDQVTGIRFYRGRGNLL